jgi:hypothetical protein
MDREKWGVFPENAAKNEDLRHHTEAPSVNEINGANNLPVCGNYLCGLG